MKITCLVDDTSLNSALQAEHGLSLYIESHGHRLLFDMGQSDLFAKNAEALGIDLSLVEAAVISHGHYDHGGGLEAFLNINHHAPVYVHEKAFEPHYNPHEKFIGLPPHLANHPRLVKTQFKQTVFPYMTLFNWDQRPDGVHIPAPTFYVKGQTRLICDDFEHEQYLYIYEEGVGTVLLTGCSHRGILNILPHMNPHVVVGGCHLLHCENHSTLKFIAQSLDRSPASFYTCHCTGQAQFDFLKEHMICADKLHQIRCGDVIEL